MIQSCVGLPENVGYILLAVSLWRPLTECNRCFPRGIHNFLSFLIFTEYSRNLPKSIPTSHEVSWSSLDPCYWHIFRIKFSIIQITPLKQAGFRLPHWSRMCKTALTAGRIVTDSYQLTWDTFFLLICDWMQTCHCSYITRRSDNHLPYHRHQKRNKYGWEDSEALIQAYAIPSLRLKNSWTCLLHVHLSLVGKMVPGSL